MSNKGLQNLMLQALGCCASLNQGRKRLQTTTCVTSNSKICKAVQNCMQSLAPCLSLSLPGTASSLAPSQAVLRSRAKILPLPLPGDASATNPSKQLHHFAAPLKACRAPGGREPSLSWRKSWHNA